MAITWKKKVKVYKTLVEKVSCLFCSVPLSEGNWERTVGWRGDCEPSLTRAADGITQRTLKGRDRERPVQNNKRKAPLFLDGRITDVSLVMTKVHQHKREKRLKPRESSSDRHRADAQLVTAAGVGQRVPSWHGESNRDREQQNPQQLGRHQLSPPSPAASENHSGQLSGPSTKQYEPHSINPPPAAPLFPISWSRWNPVEYK